MTMIKRLLRSKKGSMATSYMLVTAAAVIGIVGGTQAAQDTSKVFLKDTGVRLEEERMEVPVRLCVDHVDFLGNGRYKSPTHGLSHKEDRLLDEKGYIAVYCDRRGLKADAAGEDAYSGGWLTLVTQAPGFDQEKIKDHKADNGNGNDDNAGDDTDTGDTDDTGNGNGKSNKNK
jgi:hypothetical protein